MRSVTPTLYLPLPDFRFSANTVEGPPPPQELLCRNGGAQGAAATCKQRLLDLLWKDYTAPHLKDRSTAELAHLYLRLQAWKASPVHRAQGLPTLDALRARNIGAPCADKGPKDRLLKSLCDTYTDP
ncbi:MAG TPA: hypothetical protein VHL57_05045, partial [Flavobacteriales bacterium]|nr:hypothetical protein [Flavobacteriales bacterium]